MLCKPSPVPGRQDDAPEKPAIEAAERRTPTGTVEVEERSPVSQEWETTLGFSSWFWIVTMTPSWPTISEHNRGGG